MANNTRIQLNLRHGWLGWWPKQGLKAILDPENARIAEFLEEQSEQLSRESLLLDAGAGECPYKYIFKGVNYQSTDMPGGFYEHPHDFECELHNIPKDDNVYDAVVLTQVLEHVPDPEITLTEVCRVLKPNGKLLLSAPLNGPLHGEPWHYFQFTHHGFNQLAQKTGFQIAEMEKMGGAFWLIGKRLPVAFKKLVKQYDPFRAKKTQSKCVICHFDDFIVTANLVCFVSSKCIYHPSFVLLDGLLGSRKNFYHRLYSGFREE